MRCCLSLAAVTTVTGRRSRDRRPVAGMCRTGPVLVAPDRTRRAEDGSLYASERTGKLRRVTAVDPADFHTGIDADFSGPLKSYSRDPEPYAALLPQVATPALELGCGGGGRLLELCRRGLGVDGVDSSADVLERLRLSACRARKLSSTTGPRARSYLAAAPSCATERVAANRISFEACGAGDHSDRDINVVVGMKKTGPLVVTWLLRPVTSKETRCPCVTGPLLSQEDLGRSPG